MVSIPKATKPREVICFFPVEFPAKEGVVYFFIAKDVFSQFLFQTGLEQDNGIEQVLKHLVLLMKDEEFKRYSKQPFTLVLHKHQQHKMQIEQIIAPHGGSVVFDDLYLARHMSDVMEDLYKSITQRQGNSNG
ncbi:hypothetical protein [Salibacter halophilus]|uniref:Uncharacterized protein n=1 Tax=Salibacter halophilus TaxID=1803916 RepID=A0A6N6M408_9FLAO|nr:hypothetical protein [Salibacter halophilus]KAB1061472.1 hypothetical protein F3059_13525 [Salibacter halophilus]